MALDQHLPTSSYTMAVIAGPAEIWEYKFDPCILPHRDDDKPVLSHEEAIK